MAKKQEFEELSAKILKLAALSQFSFAAREKLQNNIKKLLSSLTESIGMEAAMDQVQLLRKLLSNVTNNLSEEKFRKVNTAHPKLAHLSPALLKILTTVGFSRSETLYTLKIPENAAMINPASILIAIGVIDKYLDENRYLVAKLKRQAKDDALRANLDIPDQPETTKAEAQKSSKGSVIDPNIVQLKMRLQGLKKVHTIELQKSSELSELLPYLRNISDFDDNDVAEIQLTCAAKRLVINLTPEMLRQTFEELKLYPAANVVIKLPSMQSATDTNSLTERAKANREKRKGSHTMASVGIYSTEDNAKGELIDGGGGVLWEQDVSDTEDEDNKAELPENEGEGEITKSADESHIVTGNEEL
uniref:PUB domain-containing protein n=1 Tax=Leptocylindrus danicus TaxID=163516 RepID=A0A7S2K507_9STRA